MTNFNLGWRKANELRDNPYRPAPRRSRTYEWVMFGISIFGILYLMSHGANS